MSELINNRDHRIQTLKGIIKDLNEGAEVEPVRKRLKELVKKTSGSEIIAMEDSLIADGMDPQEVKGMCDLHSQVLRDIVGEPAVPETQAGHPVHTFVRENAEIRRLTTSLRGMVSELYDDSPLKTVETGIDDWRAALRELQDLEKHYARKENLLFAYLERHQITGPSKVMWAKDDDIRKMIRALQDALETEGLTLGEWRKAAREMVEPTIAAIDEMIFKEEAILFPTSLEALTAEECGGDLPETPRFGYCLAEPGDEYRPPKAKAAEHSGTLPSGGAIVFPSGALTEDQLLGLFSSLPVDTTFVDADDRVAFFSEGPDRVFARTRSIIGRKVQNCHPPASVDIVDRILDDFKRGRQSTAEFWIEMGGRFIHIRYFAVRNGEGEYIGTLEVTQDVTKIRALEGERRLLHYGGD